MDGPAGLPVAGLLFPVSCLLFRLTAGDIEHAAIKESRLPRGATAPEPVQTSVPAVAGSSDR